jgi:hypothetical protein
MKTSRRVIFGLIIVSLMIGSVFGVFQLIHILPANRISNPAGLVALCGSPLIAGTTVNNGTAGVLQSFTTAYSCRFPINPPNFPTTVAQSVLNVVTSAIYTPTFTIDTSGSTANITSVTLALNAQSVQSGAPFCTSSIPLIPLTSGTGVSLLTSYTCFNGSSSATTNTFWYTITVVVDTFGDISVGQITVSWK